MSHTDRPHRPGARRESPGKPLPRPSARGCAGALVALVAAAIASWAAGPAGAESTIVTEFASMKRVVSTTPGGMELEKLVPFTTVEHGDELKYSVAYTNHGDEPALAVKILLPIPKGVTLVAGSIERPGTTVSYSVDGGRTFAPLEDLTVTSAEGKLRPARITDVDTLRWKIDEPVPPGASGTVGCVVIFE